MMQLQTSQSVAARTSRARLSPVRASHARRPLRVCAANKTQTKVLDGKTAKLDSFQSSKAAEVALRQNDRMTTLQKHVAFFDRDGDGKISFKETVDSCRAFGLGAVPSFFVACIINGSMGWPSSRTFLPTLDIDVSGIARANHGSDTGLFDDQGHFDDAKFDALFDRFDVDGDGCWSWKELMDRTSAQRDLNDVFGWFATVFEFGLVYVIAGEDGKREKISRKTLRGIYDGSLFYELERRTLAKAQA